jgi:anti-sigma factor RsiW
MSAYYDQELASDMQLEVRRHLVECAKCAHAVAEFQRLSHLATRLPVPTPPVDLWARIESALNQPRTSLVARAVGPLLASIKAALRTRPELRFVAVAATVLVVVTGAMLLVSLAPREAEHQQMAIAADFDRYLSQFHLDADGAQQILMVNYDGQRVQAREAAAIVRYEPAAAKQIPAGYTLDGLNLLEMPCCRCVQVIWQRQAGGQLAIFEHEKEQVTWFGDRPTIAARCHGKAVRIVQLNQRLAATWASGERQLTLVGVNDIDELLRIVLHFEDTS